MSAVRILADDLTGALDSAVAFAGEVPVYIGAPGNDAAAADVSVVATATRDAPVETLPAHLDPALPWLAAARLPFKKIDSLLRGNTFAEIAYAVRTLRLRGAVFAPGFPAVGRVTIGGRQFVVPPGRSEDERVPVGAGYPADAFRVFGLPAVQGDAAPAETDAPVVRIPDVRSDVDLARVARDALRPDAGRWLWCGSGGLAQAVANALGVAAPGGEFALPPLGKGPVLVISASHHAVVRRQWDILKSAERGTVMVTHGQQATLRMAFRALGHGIDFAMFDLAPARLMTREDAAVRLTRQLEAVVQQSPRPAGLVVVGGDTLLTLCRCADVRVLAASAARRPGWGFARLVGGPWDGVPCYSRSGAFGDPDDLAAMVRLLTHRHATLKE